MPVLGISSETKHVKEKGTYPTCLSSKVPKVMNIYFISCGIMVAQVSDRQGSVKEQRGGSVEEVAASLH